MEGWKYNLPLMEQAEDEAADQEAINLAGSLGEPGFQPPEGDLVELGSVPSEDEMVEAVDLPPEGEMVDLAVPSDIAECAEWDAAELPQVDLFELAGLPPLSDLPMPSDTPEVDPLAGEGEIAPGPGVEVSSSFGGTTISARAAEGEPEALIAYGYPEFGKPSAQFSSGTTLTLNVVNQDGGATAKSVTVYAGAHRGSITLTTPLETTDIVTWQRFGKPTTAGVQGVILGFLPVSGLPSNASTEEGMVVRMSADNAGANDPALWEVAHNEVL